MQKLLDILPEGLKDKDGYLGLNWKEPTWINLLFILLHAWLLLMVIIVLGWIAIKFGTFLFSI